MLKSEKNKSQYFESCHKNNLRDFNKTNYRN